MIERYGAMVTKVRQEQSHIKELEQMYLIASAYLDSKFDYAFPDVGCVSNPLRRQNRNS
ncbi:MAG: hypothetical protein ACE5DY_06805 [Mariprofundaceae bacterium]